MRHLLLVIFLICPTTRAAAMTPEATSIADYAAHTYAESMVASLAKMVSYNTVALDGVPFEKSQIVSKRVELWPFYAGR